MSETRPTWARPGDVNAFFGLMLDNIADLVITVSVLSYTFGFPAKFALTHMAPGTAIGVLVGLPQDATEPAKLADDPVLGAKVLQAATFTWHVGICAIVISGVFNFACGLERTEPNDDHHHD